MLHLTVRIVSFKLIRALLTTGLQKFPIIRLEYMALVLQTASNFHHSNSIKINVFSFS